MSLWDVSPGGKQITQNIFLVQVIDRGNLKAVGGYADGRVLDILEFLNQER